MEIRGHGGIMDFGNSEGRGELKYGSLPWYGMDIFWNCPIRSRAYLKFEHQMSEGIYHTWGLRQKNSIVFIVQH